MNFTRKKNDHADYRANTNQQVLSSLNLNNVVKILSGMLLSYKTVNKGEWLNIISVISAYNWFLNVHENAVIYNIYKNIHCHTWEQRSLGLGVKYNKLTLTK
jgi:cytosine/uracil/thiamine/allantoin permease